MAPHELSSCTSSFPPRKPIHTWNDSYGFDVEVEEKKKTQETAIRSAFLKANTVQELLKINVDATRLKGVHPGSKIKIKVEIDTDPSSAYTTEVRYTRDPAPVPVSCVTMDFQFANKVHAALYRAWRHRVKGRDWYDVVWFSRQNTPLNLNLMAIVLGKKSLSSEQFNKLVAERIDQLDIDSAKEDVAYFIKDTTILDVWSKDFFLHCFKQIPHIKGG